MGAKRKKNKKRGTNKPEHQDSKEIETNDKTEEQKEEEKKEEEQKEEAGNGENVRGTKKGEKESISL